MFKNSPAKENLVGFLMQVFRRQFTFIKIEAKRKHIENYKIITAQSKSLVQFIGHVCVIGVHGIVAGIQKPISAPLR